MAGYFEVHSPACCGGYERRLTLRESDELRGWLILSRDIIEEERREERSRWLSLLRLLLASMSMWEVC